MLLLLSIASFSIFFQVAGVMKLIVQRVKQASVVVNSQEISKIGSSIILVDNYCNKAYTSDIESSLV